MIAGRSRDFLIFVVFCYTWVAGMGMVGGDEGLGAGCGGCLHALDDVLGSALVRVHVLVVASAALSGSDAQIARRVKVKFALGV